MRNAILLMFSFGLIFTACEENDVWENEMDAAVLQEELRVIPSCVRYVDGQAEPRGDGLSWKTAVLSVDDALDILEEAVDVDTPCEVWVRGEVENAGQLAEINPPTKNIKIFDRFEGHETVRRTHKVIHDDLSNASQKAQQLPSVVHDFPHNSEEAQQISFQPETLKHSGGDVVLSHLGLLNPLPLSSTAPYWDQSGANIYYNTGNVGIGNSSPTAKLDIYQHVGSPIHTDARNIVNIAATRAANPQNQGRLTGLNIYMRPHGSNYYNDEVTGLHVYARPRSGNYAAIFEGGNVGIGTTTPSAPLVIGDNFSPDSVWNPEMVIGDANNHAFMQIGQSVDKNLFVGWVNDTVASFTGHGLIGTHNVTTDLQLEGKDILLQNLSDGNVGIGVANPSAKLTVAGKILAEEIEVAAVVADYVFEDNFDLMSLSEVEDFIEENKHLPGVASEDEVARNGGTVSLGDSYTVLLQKIEELTLYTINQQKELRAQQEEIRELKNTVEKLSE